MTKWTVDYESHVSEEMSTAFKSGKLTIDDVKIIKRWVGEVESKGLPYSQANKDWRDHELIHGQWKGYRAISFSYSGRLIYRAKDKRLIVVVVRVSPDHNYD
jgi:mRNA-degrading endonuclease YafQ of YafQ-DinJ toxin-antitoxin module